MAGVAERCGPYPILLIVLIATVWVLSSKYPQLVIVSNPPAAADKIEFVVARDVEVNKRSHSEIAIGTTRHQPEHDVPLHDRFNTFECRPMYRVERNTSLADSEMGTVEFPCMRDKSQHGIYHYMHTVVFGMQEGGTYVEIGAMGGNWLSNTLRLDSCYNWTGVLIEASAHNYNKLVNNVKVMRSPPPKTFFGAVCKPPTKFVKFSTKKGPTAGAEVFMSETYKEMHHKKAETDPNYFVDVPCFPMSHYLRGLNRINFFSLDVEGAEYAVLETIDFSAVTIDAFVIEMDEHDPPKNAQIRSFLTRTGYVECVSNGVNTQNSIFVLKKSLDVGCVSCGTAGLV